MLTRVVALSLALFMCAASAQTLRWAARGDAGTLDPFSFNEGVTNNITGLVYESLARLDREQKFEPSLATSWSAISPLAWRFKIRQGVKFHDGSLLTVEDVVFSIERAQQESSQQAVFASYLGKPVRIDGETLELRLSRPDPLLLYHQANVRILSRNWCFAHGAERVPSFANKEEAYTTGHAMGTGPFALKQREPGTRTVLVRNSQWWDRFQGNVQEVIFVPIQNDSTRMAALLSGDIDFAQDVGTQELSRLANQPNIRLSEGPENRLIFLGFDQFRPELVYSNVRGRNPFKDVRVREAFFRAIDVAAIGRSIMQGHSVLTECMTIASVGCLVPEFERRSAPDLNRAKRLLAEAGYPKGFEVGLHCPNDRYVNDERICVAIAGMLARAGIKVELQAETKSIYFQRLLRYDASFYMLSWGGAATDAQNILDAIFHSPDGRSHKGSENYARLGDGEMDQLIDEAGVEMDPEKRRAVVADLLRRAHDRFYYLPIHRQTLTWASRVGVRPVVMPDDVVRVDWIQMD